MTPTTARDTADRIGLEVERDAALAEVERLRGIIAKAVADAKYVTKRATDKDFQAGMASQAEDTLAILARVART